MGPHEVHREWLKAINAKIIHYRFINFDKVFKRINPEKLSKINRALLRLMSLYYRFIFPNFKRIIITEGGRPLTYGRILKDKNYSSIHINIASDNYPFFLLQELINEKDFRVGKRFLIKAIKDLRSTDLIIANSKMVATDILRFCKRYNIETDIKVVYPFVNVEKYLKVNPYHRKKNVVIFIGTNYYMKGILFLPRIFKKVRQKIPDVEFIIIGRKTYYTKLIEPYASSKFRILGFVTSLIPYLTKAKILIHPAIYESFGIAPLEALAAGVLPIVSDRTGSKEFIGKISSDLVLKLDLNNFSDKIIELLNDNELRLELIMKGRELIKKEKKLRKEQSILNFVKTIKETLGRKY